MLNLGFSDKGPSRRDFLRIGSLGLGGLTLSQLMQAKGKAAAPPTSTSLNGKSVIFLHMHGGPTQFETFDPKMSAPEGVRSATGQIQTRLPGVTFGSTFTRLANLADKMAVVRSYVPGYDHSANPIVNRENHNANLGSYYARVTGLNHPVTGIPTNMLLYPQSVAPDAVPPVNGLGNFASTGPLGGSYAPFTPGAGSDLQRNMRLNIPQAALDDRRALLARLDTFNRRLDESGTMEKMDRYQEQAMNVILRGVSEAFDLSQENPRILARYDTSGLVRTDSINKKWNNHKMYNDHARTIGKLLLLARRLCESGCGFVTVNTHFVWDMHADSNNATLEEGMGYVGFPFDHAVSALIEDIEARSLSDKILLVCCGEMGRTPRINKNGGRDHWPSLGPLVFSGGGLRMGQVIGASNANGGEPASDPVRVRNLFSTIMQTLFNIAEVRLIPGLAGDVSRFITEGEPIHQLMS